MKVNLANRIQEVLSPEQVNDKTEAVAKQEKDKQEAVRQSLATLDADIRAKVDALKPRLAQDTDTSILPDEENRALTIKSAKTIKKRVETLQVAALVVMQIAIAALSMGFVTVTRLALDKEVLNRSESIRAKRVYCSENFKQFVEKFVNKDGFNITQHQKLDRELHDLYLSYKHSVLSMTSQ